MNCSCEGCRLHTPSPTPKSEEKLSSMKPVPGAKEVGDSWHRGPLAELLISTFKKNFLRNLSLQPSIQQNRNFTIGLIRTLTLKNNACGSSVLIFNSTFPYSWWLKLGMTWKDKEKSNSALICPLRGVLCMKPCRVPSYIKSSRRISWTLSSKFYSQPQIGIICFERLGELLI